MAKRGETGVRRPRKLCVIDAAVKLIRKHCSFRVTMKDLISFLVQTYADCSVTVFRVASTCNHAGDRGSGKFMIRYSVIVSE